jgi:hypothetical protein
VVEEKVEKKVANPSKMEPRDAAIRSVQYVISWIKENKVAALEAGQDFEQPSNRRTVLVLAQLMQYLRSEIFCSLFFFSFFLSDRNV